MIKIISATPNDDFTISILLDDGRSGIFDVSPYLDSGVFRELRSVDYFKQVRNYGRYIAWPNEQDLCADSIAASIRMSAAA